MRTLRIIRIVLAASFLMLSVSAILLGASASGWLKMVCKTQIIPSALSASAGAILVWLGITLIFGRFYCSTVCPIGTITEWINRGRKLFPRFNKPYSFRPGVRYSIHILIIYALTLLAGVVGVAYIIEPWNIVRNLCSWIAPEAVSLTWLSLGFSAVVGGVFGLLAVIPIVVLALLEGRRFCTDICPIGTALSLVGRYSVYHIEIDPDACTSCGLCEDICASKCVKVVSRYVDDSRCIRCLDCVAKCPEKAIKLQINRNRPATPLMTRVNSSTNS